MKDYREFTFGWIMLIVLVPVQLFVAFLFVQGIGDRPMGPGEFLLINVAFWVIFLLFYGLTTTISSVAITVSFGAGLIRKRVPLARIRSVERVRSPWIYGWGIRLIPNGMLYNISGTDGVELTFHDTKRIMRIGTRDSMNLKREIERRLI